MEKRERGGDKEREEEKGEIIYNEPFKIYLNIHEQASKMGFIVIFSHQFSFPLLQFSKKGNNYQGP